MNARTQAAHERNRHGRILAELWSNVPEFSDPKEFLATLSDSLDDLCRSYGKPLPPDIAETFGLRA